MAEILSRAANKDKTHVANEPWVEDARSNVYLMILSGYTVRNVQPQNIILQTDNEAHHIYILCERIRRNYSFKITLLYNHCKLSQF
jgi:hypothetical protein